MSFLSNGLQMVCRQYIRTHAALALSCWGDHVACKAQGQIRLVIVDVNVALVDEGQWTEGFEVGLGGVPVDLV